MADVADLEQAVRDRCIEIVGAASETTLQVTKDVCPVGQSDTAGSLRDSHHIDPPVDAGTTISADLHVDADHAVFVAEGTSPHIIRPNPPTRALHFQVGGEEVFATIVHHPGNAPNTEWWGEDALQARWTAALEAETS